MAIEVERKHLAPAGQDLQPALLALGAEPPVVERHEDRYFNAPDRDFARTDEALRLRTVEGLLELTYKGPKIGAVGKTREELVVELPATTAEGLSEVFAKLGYRAVRVVRKIRTIHRLAWENWPTAVALDDVEGLPAYVEIEIMSPPDRVAEAEAALGRLAARLGLGPEERRSYLELLLAEGGR